MNETTTDTRSAGTQEQLPFRRRRPFLFWAGIGAGVALGATVLVAELLIHRAEPILRRRVVDTLSARFESRVELESMQVSLFHGFEVSGKNLAIYPYNLAARAPTLSVDSFSFRADYASLLHTPMRIGHVTTVGLHINLPPKGRERQSPRLGEFHRNKISIVVEEVRASNSSLVLRTDKPGKTPLHFDIQNLVLQSVGPGQPLRFNATLTNPKPVGEIESSGTFGPWNDASPGNTQVEGDYSFSHADLSTLKGISGILSSRGRYQGVLDRIVVDGETDTPDFSVKVSGQKVPLHTDFHAIVDGNNGDTYLQPVVAHFLTSSLTATGHVMRMVGAPGHDISLDVVINHANIEDLLRLGVRTNPPVMRGRMKMHTKLELAPGSKDVAYRLKLTGHFAVSDAYFNNPKIQSRVDELSLRSQGRPDDAKAEAIDPNTATIASQMEGNFALDRGVLSISALRYSLPGAAVDLNGVYSLDGGKFDFAGTARLNATISQMVGGWKGLLLTPVNRFFSKNGAGTQVPVKISGTRSAPQFSLDFHGRAHKKGQNSVTR